MTANKELEYIYRRNALLIRLLKALRQFKNITNERSNWVPESGDKRCIPSREPSGRIRRNSREDKGRTIVYVRGIPNGLRVHIFFQEKGLTVESILLKQLFPVGRLTCWNLVVVRLTVDLVAELANFSSRRLRCATPPNHKLTMFPRMVTKRLQVSCRVQRTAP
ncbi:hypothetical protein CSKR_103497 [Clonorchis sinensis]|uniref:Uncharacterized protein n=2 Tax=Clonorchis sinensis TaxID=79923 RepID=A0A8T1MHG7_CLOSI|nr:hypothetical protein CSKR_103497 [Clonorchis sinensis]GAA55450.1 hypothetical protein CLF_107985 [Clonorchis sinensis]